MLVRYGLDDFVRATHLYRPLRFVFWLSPWTWFTRRRGSRGERLRRALEDLGPIFVKFGQVVSTRRDLLPPDIADELAKLQDRVPPFDGALAKARIEASLGRPVGELFASFDAVPLAAASIAQVHAATLADGRELDEALIAEIDAAGLFAARNAAPHVASAMNVSRATVYALLNAARNSSMKAAQ